MNSGKPGGKGTLVAASIAVVPILAAGLRYDLPDLPGLLAGATAWVAAQGAVGIAAYLVLYVVACLLVLPGSTLTLGAGAARGVVGGVPIVSVASTPGATAAFLVGRSFARETVARRLEGAERFRAIDESVTRGGWKIVGLTSVSPRDYVLASWIGMRPGTVICVYLGSLAGNLASLGSGRNTRTPTQRARYAVGLAATVAVTVRATRMAQAALAKRV